MERRKSNIHQQRGGEEKGCGWRSECVQERWDAEITRDRGERMREAAIGSAILIYSAEIKDRWALRVKAGFPLWRVNAGHVIETAAMFELMPDFPWLASACFPEILQEEARGRAHNPRDQITRGSAAPHWSHMAEKCNIKQLKIIWS